MAAELLKPSRRGIIASLGALFAAPAIVSVASLMPVKALEPALSLPRYGNQLLTVDMITREAVKLFTDNNAFLQSLNHQYDSEFGIEGAKVGATLRIRYPHDFVVSNGPRLHLTEPVDYELTKTLISPEISVPVALALGAAAVVQSNPALSRRGLFGMGQ